MAALSESDAEAVAVATDGRVVGRVEEGEECVAVRGLELKRPAGNSSRCDGAQLTWAAMSASVMMPTVWPFSTTRTAALWLR